MATRWEAAVFRCVGCVASKSEGWLEQFQTTEYAIDESARTEVPCSGPAAMKPFVLNSLTGLLVILSSGVFPAEGSPNQCELRF